MGFQREIPARNAGGLIRKTPIDGHDHTMIAGHDRDDHQISAVGSCRSESDASTCPIAITGFSSISRS